MISQTAEYGLRAMWHLARNSDQPQVLSKIAKATQVPKDYLYKVLQSLTRVELVRSMRGKNGGFALSKPADEITVYDIVNAVSPIRHIRQCPLTNRSDCVISDRSQKKLCSMHGFLEHLTEQVESRFRAMTLADFPPRS